MTKWYSKHARPLPWRNTADPYRIWISEIMLQQTTVVAVVPYFERFLRAFPTLAELAAAEEEEVLRLWEGLGYYSRARNIHKAARHIVANLDGEFPDEVAALVELPGIGRYTAGAIASFAFNLRAPIVEANTLRLYCRLLGYRGDPRSAAGQKLLWEFAERILPTDGWSTMKPRSRSVRGFAALQPRPPHASRKKSDQLSPGVMNQALMELGATVCTPTDPDCELCPVKSCCAAFASGLQRKIPRAAVRPEVTEVAEAAVVVARRGKYLLLKRSPGERWAGLWDFVRFPVGWNSGVGGQGSGVRLARPDQREGRGRKMHSVPDARSVRDTLSREVCERTGLEVEVGELLTELRHSVTRFRITLRCFAAEWIAGNVTSACESRWLSPAEFADVPLSVTGRKLARLLAQG